MEADDGKPVAKADRDLADTDGGEAPDATVQCDRRFLGAGDRVSQPHRAIIAGAGEQGVSVGTGHCGHPADVAGQWVSGSHTRAEPSSPPTVASRSAGPDRVPRPLPMWLGSGSRTTRLRWPGPRSPTTDLGPDGSSCSCSVDPGFGGPCSRRATGRTGLRAPFRWLPVRTGGPAWRGPTGRSQAATTPIIGSGPGAVARSCVYNGRHEPTRWRPSSSPNGAAACNTMRYSSDVTGGLWWDDENAGSSATHRAPDSCSP